MKIFGKIVSVIIAVIMLMTVVSFGAYAQEGNPEDFFIYTVENGEATITGYNPDVDYSFFMFSDVFVIPSQLGGHSVTAIGDSAFSGFSGSFTSISISDGIKSVGSLAFAQCALRFVNLPASLETMGSCIFYNGTVSCVQIVPHRPGSSLSAPENVFDYASVGYVIFYGGYSEWSRLAYPILGSTIVPDRLFFTYGDVNESTLSYYDGMLYNVSDNNSGVHGEYTAAVFGINTSVIPAEIDGVAVTAIGSGGNSYSYSPTDAPYPTFISDSCTEIVIPKSIKKINRGAFYVDSWSNDYVGEIDYCGSESEWNAVTVEPENDNLNSKHMHYNYFTHSHSFTSVNERGADCKTNGVSYKLCSVCNEKYYLTSYSLKGEHIYGEWTVTENPTTQTEGKAERTCSVCGRRESQSIPKLDAEALMPTLNENASLYVDKDKSLIYGFDLTKGIDESAARAFGLKDGTHLSYENADKPRTGDKIEIKTDGTNEIIASYTVVVFGDIDGDGKYNGTDATIAEAIINGMLNPTAAELAAADCNHDGEINKLDVDMLNRAGVLLQNVDQSKTQEELNTDSAYIEYINFISQDPEKSGGEINPDEKNDKDDNAFVRFFRMIWKFIKSLFSKKQ